MGSVEGVCDVDRKKTTWVSNMQEWMVVAGVGNRFHLARDRKAWIETVKDVNENFR